MGLFDFIKDIGQKASNEDNLEASLREAVIKAQLGIKNFQLKLEGSVATLSGEAATQKDLELARLIVGNYKGVEKVNDDGLKLAPPVQEANAGWHAPMAPGVTVPPVAPQSPVPPSSQSAQMVAVKSGDTLSKIAKHYLGSANRYPEIFEANRPMLKDPDEIFPGQIIRIPSELIVHAPH